MGQATPDGASPNETPVSCSERLHSRRARVASVAVLTGSTTTGYPRLSLNRFGPMNWPPRTSGVGGGVKLAERAGGGALRDDDVAHREQQPRQAARAGG